MSLGSKELFHSNFLHWISIVNWKAFLDIMHKMAEIKKFWWEDTFSPEMHNLEVRREYHHFDLSIYILDSENGEDGDIADNDTHEFSHNAKGSRIVQKWIPVLILENKMKSLPYRGQLVEYTDKAFEEWRTGKQIKEAMNVLKNSSLEVTDVSEEWNAKNGITFILLSLMTSSLGQEGEQDYRVPETLDYTRASEKRSLCFSFVWKHRTYRDLYGYLSKKEISSSFTENELDPLIVGDYATFLESLYKLADCWKIDSHFSFRSQIAPWDKNQDKDNEKIEEIEEYKKLRIHDIHEKLLYDQLLVELERELQRQGIKWKRFNSKTNRNSFENEYISVFTKSDYAHGVGIFEVQYFLFNSDKLNERFLKLIIQVQGERYCHMVICDGIAKGAKRVQEEMKNELGNKVSNVWDNKKLKGINQTLNQYISVNKSSPLFEWNTEPEWGKYGENNLYQYIVIPHKATVQNVINAIVEDITKINTWFK